MNRPKSYARLQKEAEEGNERLPENHGYGGAKVSARPAKRLLTTQALDGARAEASTPTTKDHVKALLGAPGSPKEVRGRQVEQAPHGRTDAADARARKAPASDAALRTEET